MTYTELLTLWRDTAASLSVVGQAIIKPAGTLTLENQPQILFPLVHVELEATANVSDFAETYTVAFVVLDQGREDYSDEFQVMAKTKWIGENLINKVQEANEFIFPEPNTWNAVPIVRDYTEHLHGWRFEVAQLVQRDRLCEYPDADSIPEPQTPQNNLLIGGSPSDITTTVLQSLPL